jgi:hypothetical protein
MSRRIQISASPIREKLIVLKGAGFLTEPSTGGIYYTSAKGRAFLDLTARLLQELQEGVVSPELEYLLSELGCEVVSQGEIETNKEVFPKNAYVHLVKTLNTAIQCWGINLKNMRFKDNPFENRVTECEWI